MHFTIDFGELKDAIREVVHQTLAAIDWPRDRIALTEAEAATACGVNRHVLRDLRLKGKLVHCRVGKKIVYTRVDLLTALDNFRN